MHTAPFLAGLVMLALAVPRTAAAITLTRFQLLENGQPLDARALTTYLNAARCSCNTPLELLVELVPNGSSEWELALVSGERCVETDGRIAGACTVLWRGAIADQERFLRIELGARALAGGSCEPREGRRPLSMLADVLGDELWIETAKLEIPIDTKPPVAPKADRVIAGEELAEVVFRDGRKSGAANARASQHYQVLCKDAGGAAVFHEPPEAKFVTAADICPGVVPTGTTTPSRTFVCSEAVGSAVSVTVLGLANHVTHLFDVVAIDSFGNSSAATRVGEATPAAEEDLWERYKRSGGGAESGHCFVATAAHGQQSHPQVRILRKFRDRILMNHDLGRELVFSYYRLSPPLAAAIAHSETARSWARTLLEPIVWSAAKILSWEEAP